MEHARRQYSPLLAVAIGYSLIVVTIWMPRSTQRHLFWFDVAFFLTAAILQVRATRFEWPRLRVSLVIAGLGVLVAGSILYLGTILGTVHPLFGRPARLLHGSTYLIWAIVQQWIQQGFFFTRLEQFLARGWVASFTTASLFGLAHLPNPVLTPITFVGGFLLSEVFRRYRTVVPLGIAHGLVGLAIALAVPDAINHHMRVGLGYLMWHG
ncbi:MAG TPA: CPBP family intramembrane glutamic endopeptidase [Candidatus Angelobacter sp.]|nr:CPBP family intramembrane glutamic endopeptidase [Candidatus Angelobacter sp.]